MKLRRYQSQMLQAVSRVFAGGHRRVLIQMPTGAGKTLVAAELVRRAGARRVLYVVPSGEILEQTSEKLDSVGCEHTVLKAGKYPSLKGVQYVLAMSQTLARRLDGNTFEKWKPDLIIVDEAHKLLDQHTHLLSHWRCTVVGLTATPVRFDGRDLHDLFPVFLLGPQIGDLQSQRHLVPSRTFESWMPDLSEVGIGRSGDYRPSELERHYMAARLFYEVPEAWRMHAKGRRTLAFTSGIEASKALVRAYLRAGVLCNCNLFTEGLDVVEIDAVQMVTSTRSLSRYLQMAGRGLRLSPKTRKRDLIVIDHGGLAGTFGLVDAQRDWNAWGITPDTRLRLCRKCERLFPPWQRRCKKCARRTRRRRQ